MDSRSYPCQANDLALSLTSSKCTLVLPHSVKQVRHQPHVQVGLTDFPKKHGGSLPKEERKDKLWILIRQPCPGVHLWASNPGLSKLQPMFDSINSY